MHGTDSVQLAVVLAEPAEIHRLDSLDPRLQLGDDLVLDLVEHTLLATAGEPCSRRPPVPEHLDAPVRRPHVVEPRVEGVAQGSKRVPEVVRRQAHVGVDGDVAERVAKPYHVGVLQCSKQPAAGQSKADENEAN